MGDTKAVPLDDIVLDERCQTRSALKQEAVDEYAEIYDEEEVTLPALQVVDVEGDLVLTDGFHRVAAARKAGMTFIRAEVVKKGTIEEAQGTALRSNHEHGVRRTNADKRKVVNMAIDLGWLDQPGSNREVAKDLGVSEKLVRNILKKRRPDKAASKPGADIRSDQIEDPDTPDIASDDQEVTPADTSDPTDDTQAADSDTDTATAEPSPIERAEAIERTAAGVFKAARQAHGEVERIAADVFPDLAEQAGDVLESARVLHEQAQAALKGARGA